MTVPTVRLRVPYITAYDEERADFRLAFGCHSQAVDGQRLSYVDPAESDWMFGVLWVRRENHQRGCPQWKQVHALRQRECMVGQLCQVCAGPAVDKGTGRVSWVLTDVPPAPSVYVTAPPTCRSCIPEAVASCPRLQRSAHAYTVGVSKSYGVVGDLFTRDAGGGVDLVRRNDFVPLDARDRLEYALARQLVVQLSDIQPAAIP